MDLLIGKCEPNQFLFHLLLRKESEWGVGCAEQRELHLKCQATVD